MINFKEPIQEPRTLYFRYTSIKKEPGEANTKKHRFLYAGFYCTSANINSFALVFLALYRYPPE